MIEEIAIIIIPVILIAIASYIIGYQNGKKAGITIVMPGKINLEEKV